MLHGRSSHNAGLGSGGEAEAIRRAQGDADGAFPEIPPLASIRTAFIAGRIALGFTDEQLAGLDGSQFDAGLPTRESIEALDVRDRPFIWDL